MTPLEIEILFKDVVSAKNFKKKSGLDKQVVYNYRHRKLPSLGTMLEVLYHLNKIKVVTN